MKEDDKMQIRKYQETDLPEMTSIWNEVVEEGITFIRMQGPAYR